MAFEQPHNFIDFLYNTNLERADSIFDGVTRKIASRIQSAYTEKMTEELLHQEDKVS